MPLFLWRLAPLERTRYRRIHDRGAENHRHYSKGFPKGVRALRLRGVGSEAVFVTPKPLW